MSKSGSNLWYISGVEKSKLSLLIKRDSLKEEKDHIEGFKHEISWVTRAGEHDLLTPFALRPTSETIIYPYFKNKIRKHCKWVKVVRWDVSYHIPLIRGR